jgi:hypothetical protein
MLPYGWDGFFQAAPRTFRASQIQDDSDDERHPMSKHFRNIDYEFRQKTV